MAKPSLGSCILGQCSEAAAALGTAVPAAAGTFLLRVLSFPFQNSAQISGVYLFEKYYCSCSIKTQCLLGCF